MFITKSLALTAALICVFMTDCRWFGIKGNGNVRTEQRAISDFSEVHADGMFDIEWKSGAPALSITTDDNLLPLVEGTVSDNHLRLHVRERILPTHGLKVVVSSLNRSGAKLKGASNVVARGLTGSSFAVDTTGAAEVTLDGAVEMLVADMTGASELNAKNLQTKTSEISTTGAADAEVNVSETLRVTITGAGSVAYHGNPKTVEKKITGAGDIKHKD